MLQHGALTALRIKSAHAQVPNADSGRLQPISKFFVATIVELIVY